jgi:hydroxymethylglutaryl-CoA reductase
MNFESETVGKEIDKVSPSRVKKSSSRLPGFYELPPKDRLKIVTELGKLSPREAKDLANFGSLDGNLIDIFIENAIGVMNLPLGIATNFKVNGKDILVPMAVEETSVLAAASHGAKLARAGGGFLTESTEPIMTGQIQLFCANSIHHGPLLTDNKEKLLAYANRGQTKLMSRGGGAKDITWRYIPELKSLIIHLHVHTGDAMGANIVNTMCEKVSTMLQELISCDVGLRILTNFTDRRTTKARCTVPRSMFHTPEFEGSEVVERIVAAYLFAKHDVYRATTNNKGVMNGIDPVVIATGNDWRAIEAGAHAWCARSGTYSPMVRWSTNNAGDLEGEIELPMAVGTVGGVTKLHPTAKASMKILGNPDAQSLAGIICSVGLAQNLSALRALASEGIQRGHMHLHKRNLELLNRQGATSK